MYVFFVFSRNIYTQTFRKGLKPRANTWKYLGGFQILCGALEDLHMQRSDTSRSYPDYFSLFDFTQKLVSINCFEGKSESFSTWKKVFNRTEIPKNSQCFSIHSPGRKHFIPSGNESGGSVFDPSFAGAWPHKIQSLPVPWPYLQAGFIACAASACHTNSSKAAEYLGLLTTFNNNTQYSITILNIQ